MENLEPIQDAAITIVATRKNYCGGDEYAQSAFLKIKADLNKQIENLKNGDLGQIESILYSQAVTLNEIFNLNAQLLALTKEPKLAQAFIQTAMKAQNQCRNTLATLAEVKRRPYRTIFVRQQNNAFNQQINCAKHELSKENLANELLEAHDEERLDIRAEIPTVTVNTPMDALEAINGCKDSRG